MMMICSADSVKISALALLKMAMHAKSGGNLEVMGMLQGKVLDNTLIVIDVFALPVEGTETRVNAQAEAYEYMIDFAETNKVHALQLKVLHFAHYVREGPTRSCESSQIYADLTCGAHAVSRQPAMHCSFEPHAP